MDDDEFGDLPDLARRAGRDLPAVARVSSPLADGRTVSALVWGEGSPRVVLLHGGAQNVHTWDQVAIRLDVPSVAFDLPGHGHSSWRPDAAYEPWLLAEDLAGPLARLAPDATVAVGMSLGGLTALALAARGARFREVVLVDVTPGVRPGRTRNVELLSGPTSYTSFEELLERTASVTGARPASIERGLRHNSHRRSDGTWGWRHHFGNGAARSVDYSPLWDEIRSLTAGLTLVRGGRSRVVQDEDLARLVALRPDLRFVEVADAGHAVQGSHPDELAALIGARTADPD